MQFCVDLGVCQGRREEEESQENVQHTPEGWEWKMIKKNKKEIEQKKTWKRHQLLPLEVFSWHDLNTSQLDDEDASNKRDESLP